MSLTNIETPKYLEISNVASNYSIKSDKYDVDGFKYTYSIVELDDVNNGSSVALFPYGNTIINPQNIIKNFGDFIFQPNIIAFRNVPNILKQYRLTVNESGVSNPDVWDYSKRNIIDAWDEGAVDTINTTNQHTSFLTKMENTHKVRINDSYTLRTLNGILLNTGIDTKFYLIGLEYTTRDGNKYKGYINQGNPWINSNDGTSYTEIKNIDGNCIDIGVGPKNLEGMFFYQKQKTDINGVVTVLNSGVTLNFSDPFKSCSGSDIISYDVFILSSTNISSSVSSVQSFEIISAVNKRYMSGIQLGYMNSYGGVDFWTFNNPNQETLNIERSTYEKNRYSLDSTGHISTNNTRRGMTSYNTIVTSRWNIKTDLLSKLEIDSLRDLWISPNVYANINDEWYSVVSLVKNIPIYSKQSKGQVQYSIDIELANKIKL